MDINIAHSDYSHSLSTFPIFQTKQVQNNPHGHPHRAVDRPKIGGSLRRQGKRKKAFLLSLLFQVILKWYIYTFSKVYCSDILDAITKDFFARKGGAMDETTHVTDIQVQDKKKKTFFANRLIAFGILAKSNQKHL